MAERVFAMPDLGEGLDEGTIVAWLVAEGDDVVLNQPLVEVETAKAAVEIPSPMAGRVVTLHVAIDAAVPVGGPLVTFEVTGDVGPAVDAPPGPGGPVDRAPVDVPERHAVTIASTPVVRKLAKDLGVDLRVIDGTGPGGRVTADDVHAAAEARGSAAADEGVTRVPVTATRRAIAENLERQWAIPQVTTFRTVDCAALEAFRKDLGRKDLGRKDLGRKDLGRNEFGAEGSGVSPLPVVIAAIAAIVPAHPLVNAAWGGDAILLSSAIHVGMAADTERGLLVPVIRDAGERGIVDLAAEIRRLADGARAGALGPSELTGATLAVSNTGSYGSESGTPILSPGTAVTLALGAIAPRALVIDGELAVRPAATFSLTFDHRVLDGAAAGRALSDLIDLLQSPSRLRDLPR